MHTIKYVKTFYKLGTPLDKIGYFAFTTKAANEAIDRMLDAYKHLQRKDLKHFRTLHSLAFNRLGMKKSEVMQDEHYEDRGRKLGIEVKPISFIEKNSRIIFSGELTLLTIDNSFEKKSKRLIKSGNVIFDLSNISKVDTACLAWLLAMLELSAKKSCQLTFDNLPKDLIKLAQLSRVDMFLPKTDK